MNDPKKIETPRPEFLGHLQKVKSEKTYRCAKCGHTQKIATNHFGQCYSFGMFNVCPVCPPYQKYPQYGGFTVWECIEPITEEKSDD